MTRQCCVCKKIYHDGQWIHVAQEDLDEEEITHGYCDECAERLRAALFGTPCPQAL